MTRELTISMAVASRAWKQASASLREGRPWVWAAWEARDRTTRAVASVFRSIRKRSKASAQHRRTSDSMSRSKLLRRKKP